MLQELTGFRRVSAPVPSGPETRRVNQTLIPRIDMLNWTLTFLVIAIIAAVLGFAGIAGTAAEIARILFMVFLVIWIVSLIMGKRKPS